METTVWIETCQNGKEQANYLDQCSATMVLLYLWEKVLSYWVTKYLKFWPAYFLQIALLALGSLTNPVIFFLQSRTSFSLIPNSFPAFLLQRWYSSFAWSSLFHITNTQSVHLTTPTNLFGLWNIRSICRTLRKVCLNVQLILWQIRYIMIINLHCSITILAHEYIHDVE